MGAFHERFSKLSKCFILVIAQLRISRECLSFELSYRIGCQIEELWEALSQDSDVLKSIVFIWIIFQQEGITVTHVSPHGQIIPCLEIGVILIPALSTFCLYGEIQEAIGVVNLTGSFVQAKLSREG